MLRQIPSHATINPATKYAVFRVSDKRQIKARLAANGYSIGKSRNAELAECDILSRRFNISKLFVGRKSGN
ncbi:MAG: hypothetical protein GY779_06630 [Gammaproteobacteria bacterium]|nr:hypothetical protein [Gammaproteobacteria bacterium]